MGRCAALVAHSHVIPMTSSSAESHMPRPCSMRNCRPPLPLLWSFSFILLFLAHVLRLLLISSFTILLVPSTRLRPLAEVPRHHGYALGELPLLRSRASGPLTPTKQSRLDALALNPDLAPFLAILKGARNGIVYGSKVRFPHALVYVPTSENIPVTERS